MNDSKDQEEMAKLFELVKQLQDQTDSLTQSMLGVAFRRLGAMTLEEAMSRNSAQFTIGSANPIPVGLAAGHIVLPALLESFAPFLSGLMARTYLTSQEKRELDELLSSLSSVLSAGARLCEGTRLLLRIGD